MAMSSVPQLLIILAIVVLLFGAKKIPDLAKGLGAGIKNFKNAVKDDENDASQNIANQELENKQNIKNADLSSENTKDESIKKV
ncbi:twin-arginine translocase TatA/TatE family subunit [Helicobacter sp. MIT 14-3879]|uniref:twin-arginine translocase TatA/TatE family subunit n=1 Tax=Helicobacter sp. MIT 14-3879 TaxID=2040649 RepID=UPI000E1F2E7D|nr:twin-arginine translocase TatA/TatE family subunit [Helicobacter sp. MIT 14-3879]RDU65094.1 twin-arginine translocase TatA/TatE family subunit [Helicobacter sp. MIT 14-3879]